MFPLTVETGGDARFALLSIPAGDRPILWVQDRLSASEVGRPYPPGVGDRRRILHVAAARPIDALWAMEEGLRCAGVAAVIGEIWGDPPALTFTATKRLAIRAEAAGVPCWLIRRAASPDLSAARERWRISAIPSTPNPDDGEAPGDPRWLVELFRSRQSQPGDWVTRHVRETDNVDFSTPFRDRALAEERGAVGRRGVG